MDWSSQSTNKFCLMHCTCLDCYCYSSKINALELFTLMDRCTAMTAYAHAHQNYLDVAFIFHFCSQKIFVSSSAFFFLFFYRTHQQFLIEFNKICLYLFLCWRWGKNAFFLISTISLDAYIVHRLFIVVGSHHSYFFFSIFPRLYHFSSIFERLAVAVDVSWILIVDCIECY